MRAVIQRVTSAAVRIDQQVSGSINQGLLVLLGIEDADTEEDIDWLSGKIINLRIFNDSPGRYEHFFDGDQRELLLVSQFTLHASTRKGNRPSYIRASKPPVAIPLYEKMIDQLEGT